MNYYRRLPLTGRATNVRDLGGYAAAEGSAVRFGRFIRSDDPANLSAQDVEFLLDYGVRTVVDIRGANEVAKHRHPLFGKEGVTALHLSMLNVDEIMPEEDISLYTLGELYVQMADHSEEWIKDVLHAIAKSRPCVMFNCTAGKDRTGILAAILLSIAGVCREDIVADYALTRVYLEEELRRYKQLFPVFADAPPRAMQHFLDIFDSRYGGVVNAVRRMGVSEEDISAIRAMMTEQA